MGSIFIVQMEDEHYEVTITIEKLIDKFECQKFSWAITNRKYKEMKNSLEMAKRL